MDEQRLKWRSIGSEPVSPENPSGESARYDPEFERLQVEMRKLENLSGEAVDWKQVASLSEEILEKKSKDLLVGGYLVLGLLVTEGFSGLSNGLACIEGLISDHWPSLYPAANRMRARINALNWLSEKAGTIISRIEPSQSDGEMLGVCGDQVKTLESLIQEKLGPEAPRLTDLHRPIQEYLNRISAGKSDASEDASEQQAKIEARPTPVTPAPATKLETSEDAKRALKDSFSTLKRIGSFMRSQDPTKPLSYRLNRFLAWCEIDALPPAENGRSRIPAPPNQLRDRLQGLTEQSAWKELAGQVEARVAEFPFWLDLHRMSETALAELGQEYAGARQAVRSEVATLLGRLPDLVAFEFADGTPFANESTRMWISKQIFQAKDTEPAEVVIPEYETGSLDELRRKSRQLLQEGKLKEALSLVQDAKISAPSQRQRFSIQLELVNLCIEAGQIKAALAHLEMLEDQITRFSLEVWEPQLASKALQAYWHVLNKALRESKQPTPDLSRLMETVYSRLCKLDVLAGLSAAKQK